MDFTLPERSQAVADLAAEVLRGEDPWKELARAGLLDVSPPDGLGVLEVCVLLTEIGKRAPSMQPLATLMTGALPLARWGHADLAPGELVTAAIREPGDPTPFPPATAVTNGTITGLKIGVPYAAEAHRILVPARLTTPPFMIAGSSGHIATKTTRDHGVALLYHRSPAVTLPRTPSSCSEPEYALRLDEAPVEAGLGGAGRVRDLYQLAAAGGGALIHGAEARAPPPGPGPVETPGGGGPPVAAFQRGCEAAWQG